MVAVAATRGYDTRTGFEDTLTLPDGARAESNAALVTAARRIVGGAVTLPFDGPFDGENRRAK
jgi:uncharacterized protein (DUF849 family)